MITAVACATTYAEPSSAQTGSAAQHSDLPRAPAFRARDLATPAITGWLTNGGTLSNQRFSPLTQINRGNVANLRAEWRASLGGSGTQPRSANQVQPIVYDGVIYVVTGDNDAFAISVDSGEVLWDYRAPHCGVR